MQMQRYLGVVISQEGTAQRREGAKDARRWHRTERLKKLNLPKKAERGASTHCEVSDNQKGQAIFDRS